jgi:hypothetical protein
MRKLLLFSFTTSLVALALIMTGCGNSVVREVGEFEPYVARFEAEAAARGAPVTVEDLKIVQGELEDPRERAVCEIGGTRTPTITVDPQAWADSTEAEREELIFHEMGHCVLRRKHDTALDLEGKPKSLMHPLKIGTDTYLSQQTVYLDELFSQSQEF